MGAWGTGLYSDDFALDVKSEFLGQYRTKIVRYCLNASMKDDADKKIAKDCIKFTV